MSCVRESKGLTEPKLLLKAVTDEDHIEHINNKVNETGMEPHGSDEPPFLIIFHDFAPFQSSHLLQSEPISK